MNFLQETFDDELRQRSDATIDRAPSCWHGRKITPPISVVVEFHGSIAQTLTLPISSSSRFMCTRLFIGLCLPTAPCMNKITFKSDICGGFEEDIADSMTAPSFRMYDATGIYSGEPRTRNQSSRIRWKQTPSNKINVNGAALSWRFLQVV